MKSRLVELLSCPSCGGSLKCNATESDPSILEWQEVLAGSLVCSQCSQSYEIRDGVPRLLTDSWDESREVHNTVSGFGWEWKKFDQSIENTEMTGSDHFLDFLSPVTADFFSEKIVLDAGCGLGRFLRLGAQFGSREIIGIDLSESVDVAYRRTRALPNAHVVQADIMTPPFRIQFDYIFSVGVLHHLATPAGGFSRLAGLLKPGGHISAWVYSAENNAWLMRLVTPVRKYVTSHLPRPVLLALSHVLGLPLFGVLKLVYRPINKRASKLARFLPYNGYLSYTSQFSYSAVVSIVFDHLVPQLCSYVSRDDFEAWFRSNSLSDIQIKPRNNMSWTGFARRAARGDESDTIVQGKNMSVAGGGSPEHDSITSTGG